MDTEQINMHHHIASNHQTEVTSQKTRYDRVFSVLIDTLTQLDALNRSYGIYPEYPRQWY